MDNLGFRPTELWALEVLANDNNRDRHITWSLKRRPEPTAILPPQKSWYARCPSRYHTYFHRYQYPTFAAHPFWLPPPRSLADVPKLYPHFPQIYSAVICGVVICLLPIIIDYYAKWQHIKYGGLHKYSTQCTQLYLFQTEENKRRIKW